MGKRVSKRVRKKATPVESVRATGNIRRDLAALRSGLTLTYPANDERLDIDIRYVRAIFRVSSQFPDAVFGTVCTLFNSANRSVLRSIHRELGPIFESFLIHLDRDVEHAGWLVGEVLGREWPTREGVNILLRVLQSDDGRPGGRWCAAVAIEQAMTDDLSKLDIARIRAVLLLEIRVEDNRFVRSALVSALEAVLDAVETDLRKR